MPFLYFLFNVTRAVCSLINTLTYQLKEKVLGIISKKMTDLEKIVCTSLATAFGSFCIFVLGQIILERYIKPVSELKKQLSNIAHILRFHAGWISSPGKDDKDGNKSKASDDLRKNAIELRSKAYAVPNYKRLECFKLVPKYEDIDKIEGDLIYICNNIFTNFSGDHEEREYYKSTFNDMENLLKKYLPLYKMKGEV